MKNKQNEQRSDSQSRLNSLLQKDPVNEVVRFDPSVFMKSKVILPDVSRQNINSPLSSTSFSKDNIIALVSANNIKRVFHSRTLSLASQTPANDPSFVMQTPTKASLTNALGIDMSEIVSNSDFQTTMYSSMISSKKREIPKLLMFPKQRIASAQKASPKQLASHRSSVELDLPQTERPGNNHQKIQIIQDNYKKALDSFFTSFDKNRSIEKPSTPKKRLLGAFSSQPASPVSKRCDITEIEKTRPFKPLSIKPPEVLDFGILKMSETPLSNRSNRAKRNLKIASTTNYQPVRGISPKNQYIEESTKMPESAKIRSDGNIGSNSNATGTQSEIPLIRRDDTSSIPRIELPDSQSKIGGGQNPRDLVDNNFMQKNGNEQEMGKTPFKKESSYKIKKMEDNNRLKIQPHGSLLLNKQSSIDFSMQISTNPTSQQEVSKANQADVTKESNNNPTSNTLLSKQGTFDSQNARPESPRIKVKKPLQSSFAEAQKEQISAKVPTTESEKEKKMEEIKNARRSSFGEVFSLIQKQQQTRRNSSFRNLGNVSLLQNLFPDMVAKTNDKEVENNKDNPFAEKKLKISLPQDNQPFGRSGDTPKHIKVTTPHNLHIDLGLFSHKTRLMEKEENIDLKLELEANQSSISPKTMNSPDDASKTGFTPLVGFGTPSPSNGRRALGIPILGLNGLSPCFSDRSAQVTNIVDIPEPTSKKGKKTFAQVCKQVIQIRRARKGARTTIDTKKDDGENNTHRSTKEKEIASAGERKQRRLSRTGDFFSAVPSPPPSSSREFASFRSVPRVAEDYISGKKKISFLNKESTGREMSLLRSIIKDNEEGNTKERAHKKSYSIFSGGPRLKSPTSSKGPQVLLTKSDPNSLNSSAADIQIQSSLTSLQPPLPSRGSISFKKPKFDKTFTQKSVFAKKKEIKKIQSKIFAVNFPSKEGEPEASLKLNFKQKEKRIKMHRHEITKMNFNNIDRREDFSKAFLGNLNQINNTNRKGSQISNIDKIKSDFLLSEGPDRQKTIDFSTLLQNDDDDSLKAFPMRSVSRTGSNRSDLSKIMTLSVRDRDRENANCKFVIRILAPNSEGNVNLLAKPKGMNDNEDMPEGSRKFEYITKSKRKKQLDADIEFSPFDNPDDIYEKDYNEDVYIGDSLEISQGFDWSEKGKYFSKIEQYTNFFKFFENLTRKKNTFISKYYDDDVVQKYIAEKLAENTEPIKQIFNKKLVFRLITPIRIKMDDVCRSEDDGKEIVIFKFSLIDQCYDQTEKGSLNSMEDFLDDFNAFSLNSLVDSRGIPYLRPRTRKILKGPHGHKHLISQMDDKIQTRLFEETGHTIEDYMMLNQVNLKRTSKKEARPQINAILDKTSAKNLAFISELNFQAYRELFFGNMQCLYYIKTFDAAILQNFLQGAHPNQKTLFANRKVIRNPSLKRLPPKKESDPGTGKKGLSLLRSTVEKLNIEANKRKLSNLAEDYSFSDPNAPKDKMNEQLTKKKTPRTPGFSLEAPEDLTKSVSAPVSPHRTPERSPRDESPLNSSRSSIFGYLNRNEGLRSPNNGILKKAAESKRTSATDNINQPKSLLLKTLTLNNAHLSHLPSRFKQVVIDVMKKKNQEKIIASETKIPSMSKLNDSRMSQIQTPRKANNHIKFDNTKTISTDETKMDKGALRMRTQAQAHSKKKDLTILQQLFLAVKENREAELRELFVFCPLSLLDKKDDYGNNLLGIAAQCGFATIFEMLLSKSVNVNIPNADGNTPLHLAFAYGNHEIADKLLSLGAYQNVANKDGKFPWDLAR